MSSEEREEIVETVEGEPSIVISSFENFLRSWIDNDRLSFVLSVDSTLGVPIRSVAGLTTNLPPGLPHIQSLIAFFHANGQILSIKKVRVLCEYTDLLLDYVIYIFKYYGYHFIMEGTEIDKDNQDNIILAKRLTKIYQIMSKYIIGNPDLSDKNTRRKIKYETKHREMFKVAQDKTMVEVVSETFGIARGNSQQTNYDSDTSRSSSPRSRGGTRKIRRYKIRRKTSRLSIVRPK
jgi:hypothetical protein